MSGRFDYRSRRLSLMMGAPSSSEDSGRLICSVEERSSTGAVKEEPDDSARSRRSSIRRPMASLSPRGESAGLAL